ncbi:wingless-type MMTV integration site family member 3 [Cricetulus griseus]
MPFPEPELWAGREGRVIDRLNYRLISYLRPRALIGCSLTSSNPAARRWAPKGGGCGWRCASEKPESHFQPQVDFVPTIGGVAPPLHDRRQTSSSALLLMEPHLLGLLLGLLLSGTRVLAGYPIWWSLALGQQYTSLGSQPLLCGSIPGLVPKQLRFCRNYIEIMPSVAEGVKLGIQECQHQFRGRRWNCTTIDDSLAIFGPVLDKGHRPPRPFSFIPVRCGSGVWLRLNGLCHMPRSHGKRAVWVPVCREYGAETLGFDEGSGVRSREGVRVAPGKAVLDSSLSIFSRHPPAATRESAFVHAIASAGVAFAVTRSCAEGTSTICGCDSHHKGPPGEGWKWGGCSEDADFGVLVSREFADARENRPDARSAMNKHNNEAGRTTILDHMHLKCKCHGLSGSCEVKTCWWAQPDFRAIGDFLKDKYDSASEMVVEKHRESRGWVETLRAKYALFKPPTERDLVYYENSPNFCEPNPETGSFGTRDRTCNVTSHGIDGCDLLCCGRGHNTRTEKRKEKCHCVFHWCCYVSCQECIRIYDVHTCKPLGRGRLCGWIHSSKSRGKQDLDLGQSSALATRSADYLPAACDERPGPSLPRTGGPSFLI